MFPFSLNFSSFSTGFNPPPSRYFPAPISASDVLLKPLCHLRPTGPTAGSRLGLQPTTVIACSAIGSWVFPRWLLDHHLPNSPPLPYPGRRGYRRDHNSMRGRLPPVSYHRSHLRRHHRASRSPADRLRQAPPAAVSPLPKAPLATRRHSGVLWPRVGCSDLVTRLHLFTRPGPSRFDRFQPYRQHFFLDMHIT